MCGIAGLIHSDRSKAIDRGILQRMNQSLVHRGPDDEGYWVDGGVGLAMRRLSIIDLEGGHQPVTNETQDVWAVFNGEIYNFREIRAQLSEKGHKFKSRSDSEVIVHLYEEYGENFVTRLRGMFAIALWDAKKKSFYLYRDRLGIKPLYYWFSSGSLAFASEIKALLEYPEVSREISISALSDYLSYLYIPSPKSIYRDIHKLPAGHFLHLSSGTLEIQSYWDFSYEPQESISEEEWVDKIRETIQDAVSAQMISDVPVGAFLSGGLDSSTVVAFMSRLSKGQCKTYSMGFRDSVFNELPYAKIVSSYFKTDHHEEVVEPDAFDLLPKIITAFDEPFGDSSAIPCYLVSHFARQQVTVALSGDGGDELFGGYLWTQKEVWLEKYRQMPESFRKQIQKLILSENYNPSRETSSWNLLKRFIYDAGLLPYESYARRASSFQPWMKNKLYQAWVSRELEMESSPDLIRSLFEQSPAQGTMNKLLYLDGKVYLPDDVLTKVDRMSMMNSLEVRVPLLDERVVELACRIPASLKFKGKTTKYILKKAMKGILPDPILKQRKQGFSIPIHRWFREDLYEHTKKMLLDSQSRSQKYFRPEFIREMLTAHKSGKASFGTQLYALFMFEMWLRMFEGSSGRAPVMAGGLGGQLG